MMQDEILEPNTSIERVLEATWMIPIWVWILFTLSAISFACWVYWAERGTARRWSRGLLASLRLLLLLLVLWMLAGWNQLQFEVEQPELALVIDRSASMATRDVNGFELPAGELQSRMEAVGGLLRRVSASQKRRLRQDYQVKCYTVAETLNLSSTSFLSDLQEIPSADGIQSKLGDTLTQLIERQSGRGVAALVIFSDGINTAGQTLHEAEKAARLAAVPIYSVVVGREFTLPDVRLADLLMDRDVYFGDRVAAEISVLASDLQSTEISVTLIDASSGSTLDETRIALSAEDNQSVARLSFVPDRPGPIPLRITASAVEGETDLSNNVINQVVNVQDKTLKVLLVHQQPSYEFRFLKHFLERSQQAGDTPVSSFQLQSVLQESDSNYVAQDQSALRLVPSQDSQLKDIDVFVFGPFNPNLVSRRSQEVIYETITEAGAGCVFLFGQGSPARELQGWPLARLLPMEPSDTRDAALSQNHVYRWQPTALGLTALPMQLASTPQQSSSLWEQLPKFQAIGHIGSLKMGAQVLATAVGTDLQRPLLVTQYAGAGRVALQATDETYRWTSISGSDIYHQRYWGQLLRWVSRGKLNQSRQISELRVEPRQTQAGQAVRIEARIGSEILDAQLPDAAIVNLTSQEQDRQTLSLTRGDPSRRTYSSSFDHLPPGQYRALLVQPTTDNPPTQDFTITAPPGEQAELRADLDAMKSLADNSRGKFYSIEDAENLFDELPRGKSTRFGDLPPIPLWNRWWIALAFTSLITAEWLIRRRVRML